VKRPKPATEAPKVTKAREAANLALEVSRKAAALAFERIKAARARAAKLTD
jgi:hypothetical protein